MKKNNKLTALLLIALIGTGIAVIWAATDDETVGDHVDSAIHKTEEIAEDTWDKTSDTAEDAMDEVKDAGEEMKDAADEATDGE